MVDVFSAISKAPSIPASTASTLSHFLDGPGAFLIEFSSTAFTDDQ